MEKYLSRKDAKMVWRNICRGERMVSRLFVTHSSLDQNIWMRESTFPSLSLHFERRNGDETRESRKPTFGPLDKTWSSFHPFLPLTLHSTTWTFTSISYQFLSYQFLSASFPFLNLSFLKWFHPWFTGCTRTSIQTTAAVNSPLHFLSTSFYFLSTFFSTSFQLPYIFSIDKQFPCWSTNLLTKNFFPTSPSSFHYSF